MTASETIDKVATSPVLTALARVAMFLTPILVTISLFVLGNYLTSQAAAMSAITSRLATDEGAIISLDKRQTVVETTIASGKANRDGQISDLSTRIDKLDTKTAAKIDQMTDALNDLTAEVSALNATMKARERP